MTASRVHDRLLGEVLIDKGAATPSDIEKALSVQAETGQLLGEILVEQGVFSEEFLRWALTEEMDVPLVHPQIAALDREALSLLPGDICRRYCVLPMYTEPDTGLGKTLVLAAANPADAAAVEDLAGRVGCSLRIVAALREELEELIVQAYGAAPLADLSIDESIFPQKALNKAASDRSGKLLLNLILKSAVEMGFETIRFSIVKNRAVVEASGNRELFRGGAEWFGILLDRLKRLAKLPLDGAGALQKGMFPFPDDDAGNSSALFRLSILSGIGCPEARLRLISPQLFYRSLIEAGFTPDQERSISNALRRPGFTLVAGQTDEGLASTLFTLMRAASLKGRAIAVEDEIYYETPGVLQLESAGMSRRQRLALFNEIKQMDFSSLLVDRVNFNELSNLMSLALSPGWVFAGATSSDLRETLRLLAFRSGELPLHKLNLVIQQIFVPLLCAECSVEIAAQDLEHELLQKIAREDSLKRRGGGCAACEGRGIVGKKYLYEALAVDASVREILIFKPERVDELVASVSLSMTDALLDAVKSGLAGADDASDLLMGG